MDLVKVFSRMVVAKTLDQLFEEARKIGRVEIDQAIFKREFKARIKFECKRGTIWAEGVAAEPAAALAEALRNARAILET